MSFVNQLYTRFVLLHLTVEQVADQFRIVVICSTHPEIEFENIYSKETKIEQKTNSEKEFKKKSKREAKKSISFSSLEEALQKALSLKVELQSKIFVINEDFSEQFLPCLVVIE